MPRQAERAQAGPRSRAFAVDAAGWAFSWAGAGGGTWARGTPTTTCTTERGPSGMREAGRQGSGGRSTGPEWRVAVKGV